MTSQISRRRIYDALEILPFCSPSPRPVQSFDISGYMAAPIVFQGRNAELRFSNFGKSWFKNNFASQLIKHPGFTIYGPAYIVFGYQLMYRHAATIDYYQIVKDLSGLTLNGQVRVLEGDAAVPHWAVFTSHPNDALVVKMAIP